jgi:hypothetical protein
VTQTQITNDGPFQTYFRLASAGDVNPSTTGATCTYTVANAETVMLIGAVAFSGVDQTTPRDTPPALSSGTTTAPSHTVTAGDAEDVRIAGVIGGAWTGGITIGTGETSRVELENVSANNLAIGICTKEDGGSDAMNWTPGPTIGWGMRGFNINAAVSAGPISGSANQVFTNTAALIGAGALAGIAALAFSNTAAITGAAPISGAASSAFTNTATVSAQGALAGVSQPVFTNTGTLTGTGALAGSTLPTFSNTGTLLGAADIVGTSAAAFSLSGTLELPAGALEGAIAFANSGTLLATGTLSGTADIAFLNTASLIAPSVATTGSGGRHYTRYFDIPKKKKKQVDRLVVKLQRLEVKAQDRLDDGEFDDLLRKLHAEIEAIQQQLNQLAFQDSMVAVYIEMQKQKHEEQEVMEIARLL